MLTIRFRSKKKFIVIFLTILIELLNTKDFSVADSALKSCEISRFVCRSFSIQEETVGILSAVSLDNLITAVTDSYELKITTTKCVFLSRFS